MTTTQEIIDDIMERATRKALIDYFWGVEFERKVLMGELPMPEMPPLKVPFIYKKES